MFIKKFSCPQMTACHKYGFTLIEIMVVIVIVGAISSLAFNNYQKLVEQSRCRKAKMNLVKMANAGRVLYIKTNSFNLPVGPPITSDINLINAGLKINIDDPYFTYEYAANIVVVTCKATRIGLGYWCATVVNQNAGIHEIPICSSLTYCHAIP